MFSETIYFRETARIVYESNGLQSLHLSIKVVMFHQCII